MLSFICRPNKLDYVFVHLCTPSITDTRDPSITHNQEQDIYPVHFTSVISP